MLIPRLICPTTLEKLNDMFDHDFKVVSFFGTPSCTTKQNYAEWRDAARRSPPGEAMFCTDCTPEYQKEMIKNNRCENPWIEFKWTDAQEEVNPDLFTPAGRRIMEISDKGITGIIPTWVKRSKKPRP